ARRRHNNTLDLRQHRGGVADFELARGLDVQLLDHAVLQQGGVALRSHAHAAGVEVELQAQRPRPVRRSVGEHAHPAGGVLLAAPGAHHEGIIAGDAPDFVDALVFERLRAFDVARQVLGRTCGRKRARHGKHGNGLAFYQVGYLEIVGTNRAAARFGVEKFGQGAVGHAVADFDGHVCSPDQANAKTGGSRPLTRHHSASPALEGEWPRPRVAPWKNRAHTDTTGYRGGCTAVARPCHNRAMRTVLIFGLALAACLAGGPGARAQAQNEFDQLVATSGATNGAAQACGATPQALASHKEVMLANLRRYAAEFGYSA